jgi:hypothetical protein
VTIEGPIDDARGTIGRFSEVVLVEDTRPLTTVAAYKFNRLEKRVKKSNQSAGPECNDGGFKTYRRYVSRASRKFDRGQYESARAILVQLNSLIRANAGWCTPDTYPNNVVGELLSMSKTTIFSLDQLIPAAREVPEVGSPTTLALSATSPMADRSRIELMGPAGTEVAARVYNASGRVVATLFEGQLPAGGERLIWDGTDTSGQRVSSGVYFVRLESEGESRASKVVLIR